VIGIILVVKLRLEPIQGYEVLSAKVLRTQGNKVMAHKISEGEFSQKLERFGFDEIEVRLEIEEAVESIGNEEIL